jgi:hypothetical protein
VRGALDRSLANTDGLLSSVLAAFYGSPAAAATALESQLPAPEESASAAFDRADPAGAALAALLAENQDRTVVRSNAAAAAPATGNASAVPRFSAVATALNAPAPWPVADGFAALIGALPPLRVDELLSRQLENIYVRPVAGSVAALRLQLLLPRCAAAALALDGPALRRHAAAAEAALAELGLAPAPADPDAIAPAAPATGPAALRKQLWALWLRVCEAGATLSEAAAASERDGTAGDDWEQARALRWQVVATSLVALAAELEAVVKAHAAAATAAAADAATGIAACSTLAALPLALLAACLPSWAVGVPAPKTARAAIKAQVAAAGRPPLAAPAEEAAATAYAAPRASLGDLATAMRHAADALTAALGKVDVAVPAHRSSVAYFCTTEADAAEALAGPTVEAPACGASATHTAVVLQRIAKDREQAKAEALAIVKALSGVMKSFSTAK